MNIDEWLKNNSAYRLHKINLRKFKNIECCEKKPIYINKEILVCHPQIEQNVFMPLFKCDVCNCYYLEHDNKYFKIDNILRYYIKES